MAILTVYVTGTKKEANIRLAKGEILYCLQFGVAGESEHTLNSMPNDTVIKFYTKRVNGNPYATTYGTWKLAKKKIV